MIHWSHEACPEWVPSVTLQPRLGGKSRELLAPCGYLRPELTVLSPYCTPVRTCSPALGHGLCVSISPRLLIALEGRACSLHPPHGAHLFSSTSIYSALKHTRLSVICQGLSREQDQQVSACMQLEACLMGRQAKYK